MKVGIGTERRWRAFHRPLASSPAQRRIVLSLKCEIGSTISRQYSRDLRILRGKLVSFLVGGFGKR